MLRHRGARSTERYAELADSARVETFGAHQGRDRGRRRRVRARGVLMGLGEGRRIRPRRLKPPLPV